MVAQLLPLLRFLEAAAHHASKPAVPSGPSTDPDVATAQTSSTAPAAGARQTAAVAVSNVSAATAAAQAVSDAAAAIVAAGDLAEADGEQLRSAAAARGVQGAGEGSGESEGVDDMDEDEDEEEDLDEEVDIEGNPGTQFSILTQQDYNSTVTAKAR